MSGLVLVFFGLWALPAFALEAPAGARIVTLAPSLAEITAEVLDGDLSSLVGVSEYTDFPRELSKRASVGPYARVLIERVVSLRPTLVLATQDGNSKEQIEHLGELGLTVVVVQSKTLADVERSFITIGTALKLRSRGELLARRFQKNLSEIRQLAPVKRPRVMIQLNADPLIVVGGEGFLAEAIEVAGGRNVYADLHSSYPRPSVEDAVARKPDFLIVLSMGSAADVFERMVKSWSRFPSMPAVARRRAVAMPGDDLVRPSSRLIRGIRDLQKQLRGAE